jgi:hypothetical protein
MIRLVSVVGHGVNLLPHFIEHYQPYVDEIQLVIYETDKYPLLANEVSQIIEGYDNVHIVKVHKDRIFDWERVTVLYNYVTYKEPNDWWVIADIDEFHLYPMDLRELINLCNDNGNQIVRGGFIDRIGEDGGFPEIEHKKSIFKQFPTMGFFRYPMSEACPNKICIKKGSIELTSGQHYAKINGNTTWRWQGWNHPLIMNDYTVQVHHFKWDATSGQRIRDVANTNASYAYSEEYRKMYRSLAKTRFKIDLDEPEYMIVKSNGEANYETYHLWNKLIKKIMSI